MAALPPQVEVGGFAALKVVRPTQAEIVEQLRRSMRWLFR
jgi:hypothetical protein